MADDMPRELEAEVRDAMRSLSGPSLSERATELWLAPVRKQLAVVNASSSKTIGELTMPEAIAWLYCLTYAAVTGIVIGAVAFNVLEVALGARR